MNHCSGNIFSQQNPADVVRPGHAWAGGDRRMSLKSLLRDSFRARNSDASSATTKIQGALSKSTAVAFTDRIEPSTQASPASSARPQNIRRNKRSKPRLQSGESAKDQQRDTVRDMALLVRSGSERMVHQRRLERKMNVVAAAASEVKP